MNSPSQTLVTTRTVQPSILHLTACGGINAFLEKLRASSLLPAEAIGRWEREFLPADAQEAGDMLAFLLCSIIRPAIANLGDNRLAQEQLLALEDELKLLMSQMLGSENEVDAVISLAERAMLLQIKIESIRVRFMAMQEQLHRHAADAFDGWRERFEELRFMLREAQESRTNGSEGVNTELNRLMGVLDGLSHRVLGGVEAIEGLESRGIRMEEDLIALWEEGRNILQRL